MRRAWTFSVSILLIALCLAKQGRACHGPAGLEDLIEVSEQALFVEILDVEYLPRGSLDKVHDMAVDMAAFVSGDLAMALDEQLPRQYHYVVSTRVISHLNAHGPRPTSLSWSLDDWYHCGFDFTGTLLDTRAILKPGRQAVVFLGHPELPMWSRFDLALVTGQGDSVLVLGEQQNPAELTVLVERAFAAKEVTTEWLSTEWLSAAVRSPTSRGFLSDAFLTNSGLPRLPPRDIASALIERPAGTASDLVLLDYLDTTASVDLDLLALNLADIWLEAGSPRTLARDAVYIAMKRWSLAEQGGAAIGDADLEPLRALWLQMRGSELPQVDDPSLRRAVQAWRQVIAESEAFHRSLLATSQ